MRVLLADDHGIVRRGLRSLLEEAGLSVVAEAADGLEAVRLTEEHLPDLLIVDIGMPRLNGIEVAARSQKLERPPETVPATIRELVTGIIMLEGRLLLLLDTARVMDFAGATALLS